MSNSTSAVPFSPYMKKSLGISSAPTEATLNYGYALLAIAGADAEVSEAEFNWLANHQRTVGVPEEIIEQYSKFNYKNADLEELLSKITVDVTGWSKSRTLLYHAIQMVRADADYSLREQEAVKKAAKLLKIEDDIALAIHRLVDAEEALTALRRALIQTDTLA